MQIKELLTQEEIRASYVIFSQIYDNLRPKDYVSRILNMMQRGYKMAAVVERADTKQEKCLGVIGLSVKETLQFGTILEIEDFMIDRDYRGIGVGKMLVKWVQWQAFSFNCDSIIADLNTIRFDSHKIFSREKFIIEGFSFRKIIY